MSPSAVSLVPPAATRPVPDAPALEPEQPTTAAVGPDPEVDDTASVSDESIFIIERNSVPFSSTDLPSGAELTRRVHRDWLTRRGVEFPGRASSQQEVAPGSGRVRAAAVAKPPLLSLDTGTKLNLNEGISPPPASPKRRFLTLSPLRTMFPPKSPVHEARAMSAHPAPGGSASPYAASRSTFFRSTSSLATSLLPLLPVHKSGSLSRRIFANRAKVKPASPLEQLDAWEVLEEEEEYQGVDMEGAMHPASLMSAIAAMRPLVDIGTSPTRSQSFTFGAQAHASPTTTRSHHPYTLSQEFGIDDTTSSPSRDWKGPSTAFIDRPLNRRTGASPSTLSLVPKATLQNPNASLINLPLPSPSTSSVLEPVRLRPVAASPPPSLAYKRTAHVMHASPLRVEAQPHIIISSPEVNSALHQRALETPLPPTPLQRTEFEDDATSGAHGPVADIRSNIDARFLSRTSPQLSLAVHHRFAASASAINLLDEPMTPTRHHYAGRPLPLPPSTTRVGTSESSTAQSSCPEGLLIDLDDTTLDDSPSGTSTPHSDYSRGALFPPRPQMSQSTSSVDVIRENAQPTHDAFSDLTDLDLLVAGLSERPQDGSDYDVSLSPARPASHARGLTAAPADLAPTFRAHRARDPATWDGVGAAASALRTQLGGHRAH